MDSPLIDRLIIEVSDAKNNLIISVGLINFAEILKLLSWKDLQDPSFEA
jgi:hypothetical protein